MNPVSPVVSDAFGLLCDDLIEHLCEGEDLAGKIDEWTEADVDAAHRLIGDLVLIIRGLVIEHQVQSGGICRTCQSAWPCPVVTTIHALVKDPNREFVARAPGT